MWGGKRLAFLLKRLKEFENSRYVPKKKEAKKKTKLFFLAHFAVFHLWGNLFWTTTEQPEPETDVD